ncbi:hypothetical protein H257_05507 [Aphanomyces astaci]|uniref:Uncharacterized protein n=1 Tax=Aphanomyces astaci TaxID=112090 RepID=W4GRL7_APHAT|nr:hypothetical protein H257_05507 [Aphanomyces astaci]ETV81981.1 hypothetical protein H257_05507 [Aphanomyces astaci]RQM29366.1 hypothetical protein B5M09_005413 [Aphanomyces astaci]|eukprot:XP_009828718.1 hypothetical protein H257_05507 [Aphanomyces astaci]
MAALAVLRHADVVPLMGQFQGGSYQDMHELLAYVRESGRVLSYLTQKVTMSYYNFQLATAIGHFHHLFTPWLSVHGYSRLPRLLSSSSDMAAFVVVSSIYFGDVGLVEWACQHRCHFPTSYPLVDIAAWAAQLDILRLLGNHPGTTNAMDVASRDGHLVIVTYLNQHRQEGCTKAAINLAARFNHIDVVAYLQSHRSEGCSSDSLVWAATHGHLTMVQFLLRHYYDTVSSSLAMDAASQHGHLDVVKFLHAHGQTCTTDAVDYACLNGHLGIVKFLLHHRHEGATTRAMSYAAASGHLDLVTFLRQRNVPANVKMAVTNARKNGHFHVATYLCQSAPHVEFELGTLALNV